MASTSHEIAIIGTGITGIATAYYLAKNHDLADIVLIDCHQPMAFTSAQSGENYRNWWPHPQMVAFTNRSIDLLEDISRESDNRINMNRRGYALATRETNIDDLVAQLHEGLGESAERLFRYHEGPRSKSYLPPEKPDWEGAPDGVDILRGQSLIRRTFPSYAPDVQTVIHIRRGGDISGQQLGMYMMDYLKEQGAKRLTGMVKAIEDIGARMGTHGDAYMLDVQTGDGVLEVRADKIVNAAGPFVGEIAGMLDIQLPISNVFQQKIAFEDHEQAIPRDMPFSVDLDGQQIDWSEDEREILLEDPDFRWLAEDRPAGIHCRPDGGDGGAWVKLGWAFNETPESAAWEPPLDDIFPDIVLRGASRLNPSLKAYYGRLPRAMHHYGGWYTMTEENWPLIGPMGPNGAFMNCALSGFGTMAACAGGELCAAWAAGAELPSYAHEFSLKRLENAPLMQTLQKGAKGIL